MEQKLINFKGNKKGIYIQIKEGKFENIKNQLLMKLKNTKEFFQGAKVIDIRGGNLEDDKVEILENIIRSYGIAVDIQDKKSDIEEIEKKEPFDGIEEGETKFIRHTLRSGQRIEFDGNIVVLGDVNPGAVLIAKGNIVVMGSLRGIAHAGSDGNRDSIVAAFKMKATQLRIADIISRSPDDEVLSPQWPEVAKIKENTILIEPYLQKK